MNLLTEIVELMEDDSWLDRRVKNPETGNMVYVRSLSLDQRERYRPKREGEHQMQKERVKKISKSVPGANFSVRKGAGDALALLNKNTDERHFVDHLPAMTDGEVAALIAKHHAAGTKAADTAQALNPAQGLVSKKGIKPNQMTRPPEKVGIKSFEEFKARVAHVRPKNIKPIAHGINASYFMEDDEGTPLVMKVDKAKTDSYNQNVRFHQMTDELGWGYLTPHLHGGQMEGEVPVYKKKKSAAGHWTIDKSQSPGNIKDPDGIFAERVDAIPLGREADHDPEVSARLKKVKSEDVVRSALLEGLSSSRDRHEDNVMLGRNGEVHLIDNAQMFSPQFAPTSLFTGLRQENPKHKVRDELKVLDYRNHVENGEIGTNYPPEFEKLLKKIDKASDQEVAEQYGFQDVGKAGAFKRHAGNMLKHGFEAACGIGKKRVKEWMELWSYTSLTQITG